MRGKPLCRFIFGRAYRITPADAGKTARKAHETFYTKDHPRGCGENPDYASGAGFRWGSPPRMRGKHPCSASAPAQRRITPADAGKTMPADSGRALQEGSPPRMRGKLLRRILRLSGGRITPADAGKTSVFVMRLKCSQDHPRGCGENRDRIAKDAASVGSPPRMRGKLTMNAVANAITRITPADAGKTHWRKLFR